MEELEVAPRKNKIHKLLGLGAFVVLVAVVAGAAYAQQPSNQVRQRGRMGVAGAMSAGGPMGQLVAWGVIARRLNVTPDQRQSIQQLVQNSTVPQLRRDVAAARQNVAAAIINGQDPTSAANQLAGAESQLTTAGAQIVSQIFQNVLTDEQRTQAQTLWSRRQQRQSQRRQ
jgi:hypothetical protein